MCTDERFVCSRQRHVTGKDNQRRRRRFSCQPLRNLSPKHSKGVAFLLFLLSRFAAGHGERFTTQTCFVPYESAECCSTPPIERHNNLLRNQRVSNQFKLKKTNHQCYFAKRKCRTPFLVPLLLASTAKHDYCEDIEDQRPEKQFSKQIFPQWKVQKKRRHKRPRNHSNIVSCSDVNDRQKNYQRRRQRRQLRSKSMPTSTVAQILTSCDLKTLPSSQSMPPWLSQYTQEDFETFDHYLDYRAMKSVSEVSAESDLHDEKYALNVDERVDEIGGIESHSSEYDGQQSKQALLSEKLKRLELAMSGIFNEASALKTGQTHHSTSFTPYQIHEVFDSVRVASQSNINLMMGCADFLYLMLTLEEHGGINGFGSRKRADAKIGDLVAPTKTHIVTREVLIAAAFHYCDCVRARKSGFYDVVRMLMETGGTATFMEETFLPSRQYRQLREQSFTLLPYGVNNDESKENPQSTYHSDDHDDIAVVVTKKTVHRRGKSPIEKFGEESMRIAAGAAKLKRAEVMATTVNGNYDPRTSLEPRTSRTKIKPINADSLSSDASMLRSVLVSLSEDWRALVIRSAACLYRLKGIVEEDNKNSASSNSTMIYSSTSMQTARDALRVYAPLAQRMGMQRLKSEIENTAFRILYRRQYEVASALHGRDVEKMQMIIEVLMSRIQQLLRSDHVFMANVDDIFVTSRVKEPYSLWKKILRCRKEGLAVRTNLGDRDRMETFKSAFKPAQLSTKWVPDAIALRVVIRGKQMRRENDESRKTREKMLCYFAFQLITDVWPPSKSNVAKDYIKHPKSNGYQSLHYTAALMISGEEWPFEVQIRSEEMHRIAEYGVAAHWDYKLQSKKVKSLPDSTNEVRLALPSPASDVNIDKPRPRVELAQGIVQPSSDATSHSRITSYIEALTTSREILVKNNVFVFLSSSRSALDGRIISLDPNSSSVVDVLMQYGNFSERGIIDDMISGEDIEMYQNGVRISLDSELRNGDVLTLPPKIMKLITF